MPLSADEATRALVALEMKYSGNLITPTINGEYYFNKPPLYNWLLLGLFKLTGNASEWIIRIPVVLLLLIFGVSIYLGTRKKIGEKVAMISALAFISCGRILFYDSMLGLIDMSFSLLIFLNFLLIYELLRKEKYLQLFLFSYLVAATGFLMKGLPAIVFQGITILGALFFFKQQRRIISFQHLLGILVFLLITGSYYFIVWMENPTSEYFQALVSESTKRTFMEYGLWNTILHLFTFPVEQLYQLLP
jgi:4-amino-4-deoxy-L-arabinose transferase-like glycosyltransferase